MARLVVDANRILSALLRDGTTRAALLKTSATLYAPTYLLEEIERHVPELADRIGVPVDTLRTVLEPLLDRIEWVSEASYRPFLPKALAAFQDSNVKDAPYLACALAVEADAIWSHDLGFDRQRLVPRIPHPDAVID